MSLDEDALIKHIFFGNNTFINHYTRSRSKIGITNGCYIAQQIVMLKYALYKHFEGDETNIQKYEKKLYDILFGDSKEFDTISNDDPEFLKFKNRLAFIHNSSVGAFNSHSCFPYRRAYDMTDYNIIENIDPVLTNSEKYPIPLGFGTDDMDTHGMYNIEHWFIVYKQKIYGTWGSKAPDFAINFYHTEINRDEFIEFVESLKKIKKMKNTNFDETV